MDNEQLIRYIVEDREHVVSASLTYWLENSPKFSGFLYKYRSKVRSKIRQAKTDEDLEDVRFELEIPYLLLLDDRFVVEYEKYGIGSKRAPDFFVSFEQSMEFNVEVKRIRQGASGDRFDSWVKQLVERIRKVPSSLAFSIATTSLDFDSYLVGRIETEGEAIIRFVENTIHAEELKIPLGDCCEYFIPGFGDELVLLLSKPPGKLDRNGTSYNGCALPVFYTQKEPFKFSDTILDKLRQLTPGMINVLVFRSTSDTHEEEDLLESIGSLNRFIAQGNEEFFMRKGFLGIQDFLFHTRNLSGILYRSNWIRSTNIRQPGKRNFLWCNGQADHQLPEIIREHLVRMDAPRQVAY